MTATSDPVTTVVGAVLFTDLVGFTEFTDAVGDEPAVRVLDDQSNLAVALLADCDGGRLVKELGDGMMLWFAASAEAISFAVSLLHAVGDSTSGGRFPLAMRLGMHHGEAIVRGADLVGQTVNIAARVADLAGPGELLVSSAVVSTMPADDTGLGLEPIGPTRVKGVTQPIWLHRVVT